MAEEVWDAIVKATGVRSNMSVDWAMQLWNIQTQNGGVDLNGRLMSPFISGDRDTNPRSSKFSIQQALTLMNNNQVTIRTHWEFAGTAVNKLVTANATAPQIVTSLYLQTLSRYPTPAETALCLSLFTNRYSGSTVSLANDLQWALLNKLDFVYNY
jgi:hypothetical protein